MKSLCCLLVALTPVLAQVKITQNPDRIAVDIDGKPFTELFISGPGVAKPFLYPLRAATGTIVTRGYPIAKVEGDSTDHPYHTGLFFSHGELDAGGKKTHYWLNEGAQDKARISNISLKKVNAVKSGKDSGSITATFEWNTPEGKPLLTETRTMVFYSDPKLRILDVDINLQAIDQKVTFADTKEGSFAIRLAVGLEEPTKNAPALPKRTGQMVNAEGLTGEKEVWGKRSNWVDYSGELEGEKVGVAIFDNPGNPKHPTYWHSRSYGLFAANPFGEHDFYNDKTRDGSMTIEPGKTLRFRYRVVIHPDGTDLADLYKKYAKAN